jgi:hypothetical protein
MIMGERAYKILQYGVETNHGEHVAATKKWLGDAQVPKDREAVRPVYNLGVRSRASENHIYQKQISSLPLTLDDSYFQGIAWLLAMTLKGGVTPTEVTGGQGDYLWTFTPSLVAATADTMQSFTLEIGDDLQCYEVGYLMGRSIKFSAQMGANSALKVSVDAMADEVTKTTATADLPLPAITPIVANNTKIYVDTTWAGIGGTLKAGILRGWDLEIIGGLHQKFLGNSLVPNAHGVTYLDWKLALTLEDNAAAASFFTWFQAQTAAAVRLEIPGPQIGTGATHKIQFDLWGAPSQADPMGSEVDGNHVMPVTLDSLYNTVGAATLACALTTNVNTL